MLWCGRPARRMTHHPSTPNCDVVGPAFRPRNPCHPERSLGRSRRIPRKNQHPPGFSITTDAGETPAPQSAPAMLWCGRPARRMAHHPSIPTCDRVGPTSRQRNPCHPERSPRRSRRIPRKNQHPPGFSITTDAGETPAPQSAAAMLWCGRPARRMVHLHSRSDCARDARTTTSHQITLRCCRAGVPPAPAPLEASPTSSHPNSARLAPNLPC